MSMSIEASPLELTEEQAERLLDFCYETEQVVRSSTALAIVTTIARETVTRGSCTIPHREFGRRTGRCRRSIDTAIKTLKRRELIERLGTTEGGIAIYRAKLDAKRGTHGMG